MSAEDKADPSRPAAASVPSNDDAPRSASVRRVDVGVEERAAGVPSGRMLVYGAEEWERGERPPASVRSLPSSVPPSNPPSRRPSPMQTRRTVWLLAAAGVVVAAGAAGVAVVLGRETLETKVEAIRDVPLTPAQVTAAKLRDEALPACASQEWSRCKDKLDEASKADPASEADGRVQRMRADIREHAGVKP